VRKPEGGTATDWCGSEWVSIPMAWATMPQWGPGGGRRGVSNLFRITNPEGRMCLEMVIMALMIQLGLFDRDLAEDAYRCPFFFPIRNLPVS